MYDGGYHTCQYSNSTKPSLTVLSTFIVNIIMNVSNFDIRSCSSSEDTLECLQQIDSTRLEEINVALNVAGFFGTFAFVQVVDGSFITQRPIEALRQRKLNAVGSCFPLTHKCY